MGDRFAWSPVEVAEDTREGKLVEEVDEVVEASDGKIDQESIREMPYLEACIKETLRLLPPVFRTDRTCVKDWQEDGLFIPKGWSTPSHR